VTKLSSVVRGLCLALTISGAASAAAPEDRGPEINPYECLGRYEAATGNRSMTQVRAELEKRLHPLFEGDEPHTVKAMKLCVVAMLESRLGDDHAAEHYAAAVAEAPEEPGYELWYARLYANFRGARGIVVEKAEDHFYKALEKIDALKANGKFRDYHKVVEEWAHKGLLVTYQEDGLQLLPWKAFPQHGYAGHDAPGAALMAQLSVSKDTRDFFRNNEMRLFTGELMFANSPFRSLSVRRCAIETKSVCASARICLAPSTSPLQKRRWSKDRSTATTCRPQGTLLRFRWTRLSPSLTSPCRRLGLATSA
jgi:hypothetical protein